MSSHPLNRARVEASIAIAKVIFRHFRVALPTFAQWTTADWDRAGPEYEEARDCALGWDVTDFGSNDFAHIGRTLFTLRNGHIRDPRYPKGYAEKLILDPEGQRAPAHFYRTKREDIINRGGGNICVQLTRTDAEDRPAKGNLEMVVDGCRRTIASGETVRLTPGESLCIPPRTIHQFWGRRAPVIGSTASATPSAGKFRVCVTTSRTTSSSRTSPAIRALSKTRRASTIFATNTPP